MTRELELADLRASLELYDMGDIAENLRRLAETRPDVDPIEALRADGFGNLVDRLNSLTSPAPATTAGTSS
jgi:hypothetical protein